MRELMQRAVFEKSIAIDGCRFTPTALQFSRVDEETLVTAGAFLQAIENCSAWWWGDFLAAYCGYNLKVDEKENGGAFDELTRRDKEKQYSARYAAICAKEPKTLAHWKGVATFFNSSRRREELTWSHHIEAKEASDGDAAVADHWLDLAEKHKWTHAQLRAAIRRTKQAEQEPNEPMPQLILPMEVVQCRRWAGAAIKRVDDMDIEEAVALLKELDNVITLAKALASRVANAKGGKESLLAA